MCFFFLLFQDGTILDDNTELALIDAVLPDIVATRHTLLQNNKPLREIKHESNLDGSHYPNDSYKGHSEIMDIDGGVNDFGNYKATLLKGHESEVMIYSGTPPYSHLSNMVTSLLGHFFYPPGRYYHTFSCKKTLINLATPLILSNFFGPLVSARIIF